MASNRYVKPNKIEKHVKTQYEYLNEIQESVLPKIISYAGSENKSFTRSALGYILGSIEDEALMAEIGVGKERALEVLSEFLTNIEQHHRGNAKSVSQATIARTLRVYKCPRPWC